MYATCNSFPVTPVSSSRRPGKQSCTWLLESHKKGVTNKPAQVNQTGNSLLLQNFLGRNQTQLVWFASFRRNFLQSKVLHAVQDMEFLFMLSSNTWMMLCKITLPTKDILNPVSTVRLLSHLEIIERHRKLESIYWSFAMCLSHQALEKNI